MDIPIQIAGHQVNIHFCMGNHQIHSLATCPICSQTIYTEDYGLGRAQATSVIIKKLQTHMHLWHDVEDSSVDLSEFPTSLRTVNDEEPPSRARF